MNILKKIVQRLTGRKKWYYLHITYKATFGGLEWMESDRFFRINDYTLKDLRLSIQRVIEKENGKQVKELSLTNITELSKGLFDMLMRSETFNDLQK
jgi:hypothetical protein